MNLAKRLRFDLESGDTEQREIKPSGGLKKDPLRRLETVVIVGVVAIAIFLGILAVIAAFNVTFSSP